MRVEKSIESHDNSQRILSLVDQYSSEIIKGSYDSCVSLLCLIAGGEQDDLGIDMFDHSQNLGKKEFLSIQIAESWLKKFNQNFGWDYSGPELTWENNHFRGFFRSLSKSLQGILHPEREFGTQVVENLSDANHNYWELVQWAEEELRAGRVGD